MNDTEYKKLLPAMRLASNLIEVGMPYIANFLPADDLLEDAQFSEKREEVPVHGDHSHGKIQSAKEALDEIADSVHWELDWNMYSVFGSWGMNFITEQEHPYKKEEPFTILASDRDLARRCIWIRPVTIVIARQYFDTISKVGENTEEYLRAIWHCGITLAHEIGHTILLHDTRWFSPDCSEPYVGDNTFSELGLAFISWIFSGCNPETTKRGNLSYKFDAPLYWRKERQMTDGNRDPYRVHYSISTQYLENLLSQSFWDEFRNAPDYSTRARGRIKPVLETGRPKPATAVAADFWVREKGKSFRKGRLDQGKRREKIATWKNEFRDRSERPELPLKNLSALELDLAFENQKIMNGRVPESDFEQDESDLVLSDEESVDHIPFIPPSGPPAPAEESDIHHLRVEVAYTHRGWSQPSKRPRDDDYDFDEDEENYKRLKSGHRVKVAYDTDEEILDDYDKTLEDELLEISVPFIESGYTRRQANEFCKVFGLREYDSIPGYLTWQKAHLNRQYDDDRGKISQIRVFFLERLLEKHKRDKQAGLKIRQVIADSIYDWNLAELSQYCVDNGLLYDENENIYEDLHARIEDHMATEIASIKGYPGKEKSPTRDEDSDAEEDEPLRGDWDEIKFKDYFLEHELPVWGNINVWRERYYAYRYEQKHGSPRPRNTSSIRQKTGSNGAEIYSWLVNPPTRNILDLKSALYCTAVLPSTSVLHLSITMPYDAEEPDDKLLSDIPGVHEGLRFVMTVSEYEPPTKPELLLPQPERKVVWDKKELVYNALKDMKAENKRARANAIPIPPPELTLAQRMALITDQARALDQVFLPPVSNAEQPPSGERLLDALEDLEERNARLGISGTGTAVTGLFEDYESDEDDDGDGLGKGFGVGRSHMGDLYRAVGMLRKPAGRGGVPVKVELSGVEVKRGGFVL